LTDSRITYITDAPLPSYAANSVGVMNMCAAFAKCGADVHLLSAKTPWIKIKHSGDIYNYYGVEKNFSISRFLIGPYRFGIRFGFDFRAASFYKRRGGLLFTRKISSRMLDVEGVKIIYELHHPPSELVEKQVLLSEKVVKIICITQALADWAIDFYGEDLRGKISVVPDAVSENFFSAPRENRPGREVFTVGYAGSLYDGRGIDIVIGLAEKFQEVKFVIAGGTKKQILKWAKELRSENVEFLGYISPAKVADFLRSTDCLLMPYQENCMLLNNETCTGRFASPLKMFEYMACGVPIISSDMPVLQEILVDGVDALFAGASDIDQWVYALEKIISDAELGRFLAGNAFKKAGQYTWQKRAEEIMRGL